MDTHQEKMDALIADMKNGREERTACQKAMEANPEMMQFAGEHQEVLKEEAALRASGALKKRHKGRNVVADRSQKPKERTQENYGCRKNLTVAGRRMIRRAGVAWRKSNVVRKIGPRTRWNEEPRKDV
jgi:hypothetical protein